MLECQSDGDVENVEAGIVIEVGKGRLVGYSKEIFATECLSSELGAELKAVAGIAILVLLEPVEGVSIILALADDVRGQVEADERNLLDLPKVKPVHQVDRHHRRDEGGIIVPERH